MKKKKLCLMTVALLGVGIYFTSCSKSSGVIAKNNTSNFVDNDFKIQKRNKIRCNQYRVFDQVYPASKGVALWKAQLDKIIEVNHTQEAANGLHILGYAFNEKINSLEELKHIRQNLLPVFPLK